MNKLDILKLMTRHFPGGIEVVALRLGKSVSTLEKELRNAAGYKLAMFDADEISSLCIEAQSLHCHDYVNAVAGRAGRCVELPAFDIGQQGLRASLAGLVKEASDVLSTGIDSMKDEVLSDNEFKTVSRELAELMAQVQVVDRGVRAAHLAGKRVPA